MNIFSNVISQLNKRVPADADPTIETRERDIVMRLSKGNVRLQFGMYETEEDVAKQKARVLEHNFV